MKIALPKDQYIKKIDINSDNLEIEFSKRKRIALLFVCINDRYWPYLSQVIKDCRQNFLPQHKVDYFVWTDANADNQKNLLTGLEEIFNNFRTAPPEKRQETLNVFLGIFAQTIKLYEIFFPDFVVNSLKELASKGIVYKREMAKFWIESAKALTEEDIAHIHEVVKNILAHSYQDLEKSLEGATLTETAPVEWPHPTLMRYHLFLQKEEELKKYDYVFYMDADMKVVSKVSDEILGEGLTAAEHPMYALRKEYIPPYEPNRASSAYIERPGRVVDEKGKPRFKPFYVGGGFQGGKAKEYVKAMQKMKWAIDRDFDKNYIAIWNDESHWNKYLSDYRGDLNVLSPSYIYPDSLIKEYYEKIWGCSYEPKIMTLTKPFTLSTEGAEEINKFIQQ